MVFWIILAVLLLLLLTPVGVAAAGKSGEFTLAVRIAWLKIPILPSKTKEKDPKKTPKVKKAKGKNAKQEKDKPPKAGLTWDEIVSLIQTALKTLGRFFRSLSVDELRLHLWVSTGDPYDTVLKYGYIHAALGGLLPLLHNIAHIRHEHVGVEMDLQGEQMRWDAKLQLTIRIGQILWIALCALWAVGIWWLRRKKRLKRENKIMQAEKGT